MIQINLLPDIKIVYLKVRRLRLIVFLVALFVLTICTIVLLLLGAVTLVQQKNDIDSHEQTINSYVEKFNGEEGKDVRKYLAIQAKFQSLSQLKTKKIDVSRIWSSGLFTNDQSFLPKRYRDNIDRYDFNFDTGEFTIASSVDASGDDVNFRDYFRFAYYEVEQTDANGQKSWSCPLAPEEPLEGTPDWTYCQMFSELQTTSEFHPDLDAPRDVTISGQFAAEVNKDINLFDKDINMRVRVPAGCSNITCTTVPRPGENAPQDFV